MAETRPRNTDQVLLDIADYVLDYNDTFTAAQERNWIPIVQRPPGLQHLCALTGWPS
jgi:hypothetical protein